LKNSRLAQKFLIDKD